MPRLTEQLLIYGAGLAGRRIRRALAKRGHAVRGFLDRDATLHEADGLPVSSGFADAPVISKPYRIEQLATMIAQTLAG